jgi:hypothetical protein
MSAVGSTVSVSIRMRAAESLGRFTLCLCAAAGQEAQHQVASIREGRGPQIKADPHLILGSDARGTAA